MCHHKETENIRLTDFVLPYECTCKIIVMVFKILVTNICPL